MSHPFGDLVTQYRARKHGLSQAKLAEAVGYDPALIGKMCKGGKELTGPSGRDRVVFIIQALCDFGVLSSLAEANALLAAADMPPLFEGLPVEAKLIRHLNRLGAVAFSPVVKRTNLPAQLTSFIGRENEIAELSERVKATRLLTLTGSGGVGKSRLALELANAVSGAFADGVWLVELAPLSDSGLLPQTVASAFKLPEQPGRTHLDALVAYLEGRHLLLILDNCEHLIDACASLAEALLQHCPKLHVLATSRERLRVQGEVTHRVPSLTTPDAETPLNDLLQYEAVRLFRERAITSQSMFEWSASSAAASATICSRLDGIPLAIELATAQLNFFTAEQIAERLTDRFNLLTSGSRTALARHQTLHAAIAWSYTLLTPPEQTQLMWLSVFAGGFTAEAAEFVAGQPDALTSLSQLVDKSLVIAEVKDKAMRYRLLETIRQFAGDRLSEAGKREAAQCAHAEAFCELAERAEPQLYSHVDTEAYWLSRLAMEQDNFRAALAWCQTPNDRLLESSRDARAVREYCQRDRRS